MKAAIFDLFGTLVPCMSVEAQQAMLTRVARELSTAPEHIRRLWTQTADDRATGRLTSLRETFEYIIDEVAGDHSRIDEVVRIREDYIRGCMRPRPDALSALGVLNAAGLRTAVVSNCSVEVPALWDSCPLSQLIDVAVFSPQVGTTKPDPKIFQKALDALEVPSMNCVYIADGDAGELAAAALMGMNVIHLHDPGERSPAFLRDAPEAWGGPAVASIAGSVPLIMEL